MRPAPGYLNAAIGVGGVIAGIAGGALLARRLRVPLVLGGVVGGVGLAWLALTGDIVTAMLAIGVAVAGLLLLDVVNTTLIQRIVPDELRGRADGRAADDLGDSLLAGFAAGAAHRGRHERRGGAHRFRRSSRASASRRRSS